MTDAVPQSATAVCAIHPEAAAAGSCVRCGAFFCEADTAVVDGAAYCASCAARPDVDYLEAFRLKYWGKRDTWGYLAILWFVLGFFVALRGATGDNLLVLGLGLAQAGIAAAYFLLIPWARIALVGLQVAGVVVAVSSSRSGSVPNLVGVLVTVMLLTNTRNRLAFRQEVSREQLRKAWDLYANNVIARTGLLLSFLGLFVPVVGLIATLCGVLGLRRVDPNGHPPIGRKKTAIAAIALGVLGTVTSTAMWWLIASKP